MDPHESFIFAHMTTKIGRNPLLAIVAQKEIIRTFEGAVPKIITMRLINFSQNSPESHDFAGNSVRNFRKSTSNNCEENGSSSRTKSRFWKCQVIRTFASCWTHLKRILDII